MKRDVQTPLRMSFQNYQGHFVCRPQWSSFVDSGRDMLLVAGCTLRVERNVQPALGVSLQGYQGRFVCRPLFFQG